MRYKTAVKFILIANIFEASAALDDDSNEKESAMTASSSSGKSGNVTVKSLANSKITFKPLSEWFGGRGTGVDYKAYKADHGLVRPQESLYCTRQWTINLILLFHLLFL